MKFAWFAAGAASLALAAGAMATAQNRTDGGTVRYWMSAETMSGLPGMSGGGQPSPAAIARMMMGGRDQGPGFSHLLTLQIGSPRRPAGAPNAEHAPPPGLQAGPVLPLVTPAPTERPRPSGEPWERGGGNVRGRLLIFWGCGEHAPAGQPIEIDLSRIAAGQVPPELGSLPFQPMQPPNPGNSTTYGEWPNSRDDRGRIVIPATGSLVGDHVVRGNYTPDIRFTLAQGQDFLAPITLTSNTRAPSGAVPLAWQPVPNAQGYFLMSFGARDNNTMVIWTSSASRLAQIAAFDYLAPAEAARLVQQRVLLPPSATECTVPAEVSAGTQGASLMMTAFGPEANFSYPERPLRAPRGWAPDWTVKLRTRSAYFGLLGTDIAAMMRGQDGARQDRNNDQGRERRRRRNPLGGILGRVVGD
jgi:hypothetical protein